VEADRRIALLERLQRVLADKHPGGEKLLGYTPPTAGRGDVGAQLAHGGHDARRKRGLGTRGARHGPI
jgi:hypothetical protein